jgi:acetoin utilization protein AcuB
MLVKDSMIRHPFTIEPNMSIVDAQRYMGEVNVRYLPVVDNGKRLVGLITRRTLMIEPGALGSLNVWEITRYLSRLQVKNVMIKARSIVTIDPDTPIEDAARIMVQKQIGCLPVVEGPTVIGLVRSEDLLAHLTEMMVARVHGVRVTIRMPSGKGETAKLVAAISAKGWGIFACGGLHDKKDPEKWIMLIKIRGVPKDEVAAALRQIKGHEILDVRET